jgi:hypothetical protein
MLSKEDMNTGEDLLPVRPPLRYFATHSTYTVLILLTQISSTYDTQWAASFFARGRRGRP